MTIVFIGLTTYTNFINEKTPIEKLEVAMYDKRIPRNWFKPNYPIAFTSLVLVLIALLILISGCSAATPAVTNTPSATPTVTPGQVDKPRLTPQEAITAVKRYTIDSPVNHGDTIVGRALSSPTATPTVALNDWQASYIGNGKWDVSVVLSSLRYHWSLLESDLSVISIGRN